MHTQIRQRIENGFEALGRFIYKNHWLTLVVMLALLGSLVAQIPKLTIDTSTEGFLHDNDPTLLDYNDFRAQFGRDELVFIAIESPQGVFQFEFLEKLRALQNEIEDNVPYIDDINGLVNARNTRGEAHQLIVEDLLENWPQSQSELDAIKERAMANPVYRNLLLSEDGTITTIAIRTDAYSSEGVSTEDVMAGFGDDPFAAPSDDSEPEQREFLTDRENSELVAAVQSITAKYNADDFRIHVGGSPVVTHALKSAMQENMRRFMGLALLTVALILALLFRRASGVFLPMIVVIMTVLSTLGVMSLLGLAIKIPTQIMPSFLLAVSVGASVHVLAVFYRHLQKLQTEEANPMPPIEAKQASIVYALGHSGLAIVMTSLTTAAGLASFANAEVAPIADLGLVAAIGVLISLLYTIVMLPTLLSIIPLKAQTHQRATQRHERMDNLLLGIADFSVNRRKLVLGISLLIIAVGVAGALQVRFSHKPFEWFPKEHPVREATDFIDQRMRGASTVEVVIDTGEENGLYSPVRLDKLAELQTEINQIDRGELFIGKTMAVTDILKEINQALNENRSAYYTIPDDRGLIAQEFLLFSNSGSDDLEDWVDSGFSKARFTAKMPWVDAIYYIDFTKELNQRFSEALDNSDITVTGMATLLGRTMGASIHSMANSYVWAAAIITVMMILLIGDIRIGLISMIPNLTPIILTLGIMGWLDLPLDLFTMLIGSIAIGLAVDDTIHFMHNYRRYHHDTGNVLEAVRSTLLTTGRAMLVTTVVLSIGFFIFTFSTLSNLFNFGILTGATIFFALLADFFLAPALMAQLHESHLLPDDGDY